MNSLLDVKDKGKVESCNEASEINDQKCVYNEVYKQRLSELYYSMVIGEKRDMLVGSDGDLTFFEIKVVARKFIWDPTIQNFKKVVANSRSRKNERNEPFCDDNTEVKEFNS